MDFSLLKNSFIPNIKSFSYFVDWWKVSLNVKSVEKKLNLLNFLLWKKDTFKEDFFSLVSDYPEVIEVFPILLATREKKISITGQDLSDKSYSFQPFLLTTSLKEEYYNFLLQTGIVDIFINERIKNLVDYVFGIEVWLDSNARKNRSWKIMEEIVQNFIIQFCSNQEKWDCVYRSQATPTWIKAEWGIDIQIDKSERRFDFAIFNNKKKQLVLIETNFYGWGGSKLKSVAWEFSGLYKNLDIQWIKLFWVTDGNWWKTALRPLEDAYNATNGNIYNLAMLKDGILEKLIK